MFKTDKGYSIWENGNFPKLIESIEFFEQKFDYIHYNPVRKEYVYQPEDWRYSSASKIPGKIKITKL